MLLFNTNHLKVYNYIIHHFLEMEIFNGNEYINIGDKLEEMLPKYLFREQYHRCIKIFEELFKWTEDEFYHSMSAFHELALYNFIDYLANIREDMEEFDNIYFNDTCHSLIGEASQSDFNEYNDISFEEYKDNYYNIFCYSDFLFEDTDFLLIPKLYNSRKLDNTNLEEHLGINIDFYYDILPLDVQNEYKSGHITLTGEVSGMLNYIEHRLSFGNLYKLFWENNTPVLEERIQLILENIMDAYFYNQEIDITREALLGNGKVDFKLYRSKKEDEKVLIEIKRASSSYLKKGYEKQLTDYMLSTNYKNAFYLIACFTDSEIKKTEQFIRNHVYTDTIQLYINITILDLRKRKTASVS
ncbi:hypothetical protein [Paenibacillus sp. YN15]|uniref:hypothetical protein n=1 Tax=Paenibacillus sp. YN15 TaxID=1742774 RepID=UPI000DCEB0C6|nr:hypothetical protein [Paenibacillus sp. YN15]RAU91845.1 hypothetical protein DQG13_28515 [Paenibacillus sp. YN15]